MVTPINPTGSIFINPSLENNTSNNTAEKAVRTSFNSFEVEDNAIISAQAKLLNELDKFNSGEGDAVDLAITGITSKHQVEAMVQVINTKKDMMDTILEIGK
jgi:hypothetical protein